MSVGVEGYRNESFESLEAAVLETSRGRWFLEEYAKRQRSTETLAILEILRKLENTITSNFMPPAPKAAETARPINQEQLKFFKQDEDMFVEPAATAPSLTVVAAAAKTDIKAPTESRGAKLRIERVPPAQIVEEPKLATPEPEKTISTAPVQETVAVAPPQSAPEPKQRVIIIRKPASEVAEIPMMDGAKPEAAA